MELFKSLSSQKKGDKIFICEFHSYNNETNTYSFRIQEYIIYSIGKQRCYLTYPNNELIKEQQPIHGNAYATSMQEAEELMKHYLLFKKNHIFERKAKELELATNQYLNCQDKDEDYFARRIAEHEETLNRFFESNYEVLYNPK
jgi:hypothetical protein